MQLTISKRSKLNVVDSKMIPKKVKFLKYGEFFHQKPEMQERNESLQIVRDTLTDMRDNHTKSKLDLEESVYLFVCFCCWFVDGLFFLKGNGSKNLIRVI